MPPARNALGNLMARYRAVPQRRRFLTRAAAGSRKRQRRTVSQDFP